jgi:nicotinate-nucleotide adenylyltransferase
MHIGLFFGSFNPIHIGHLFIANYIAHHTNLDEVWLVVSPHNPFKDKKTLLSEYDRLHLVNLAIQGNDKLKVSNIEFSLPKPSYTIDTLVFLEEKYPQHKFSLIMGSDNLPNLHKWKNGDVLQQNYPIFVFRRPDSVIDDTLIKKGIEVIDCPQVLLSSSFIREQIKQGKSIKYLVPEAVEKYLEEMAWYK